MGCEGQTEKGHGEGKLRERVEKMQAIVGQKVSGRMKGGRERRLREKKEHRKDKDGGKEKLKK